MCDISLIMGSSFILAGPSSCGKSSFLKNLIKCRNIMFDRNIKNVYIVCSNVQNIYENLVKSKDVKKIFHQMPSEDEILEIAKIEKVRGGTILVLDDVMPEIEKSKDLIQKLFTELAHHQDMSVFLCVQNLFYNNGTFRTLSRNAAYLIPFKSPRDTRQINFLAYQSYAQNPQLVIDAYNDATNHAYCYLLMDFTQETPDFLRLRAKIFPWQIDNESPIVYLPN